MIGLVPAPTFGHAAEAFVVAHEAPGAWAKGTAVKYRQTLAALEARLADDAPGSAADVAVLGTPAGSSALEAAFAAAFGTLAPATRAWHLSALRSAIGWWAHFAEWSTLGCTAGISDAGFHVGLARGDQQPGRHRPRSARMMSVAAMIPRRPAADRLDTGQ